ncbi:MAG TPA: enoyl-CoA hydratase/isomerase family protein [Candidatus Acidoferrum sp.]|nr:enoyl-CoA hydratase/isomerase family protein [Candidatus Acidoferrum sp.]
MGFQSIQLESAERSAWILLSKPPLNILDIPMMEEISAALDGLSKETDFVLLSGAGEKAFSAGADVRDHAPERAGRMLQAFHGIIRKLALGEWITVAAVRGICLGGGCELASFCDFVIAEESATFGQPEIKLGCFPPLAVVTFPRLIGPRATADLILTGRTISAREAREMGLVTRVVGDGEAKEAARELIGEIGSKSASALRIARKAMGRFRGSEFEEALHASEELYIRELLHTHDAEEGVRAFLEKRSPAWQGR